MNIIRKLLSIFTSKPKFEAKAESDNIVSGMAKAKALHKRLVLLAHPDKNPARREQAEELTQLINKNRYNYNELLHLEQRIKAELQ